MIKIHTKITICIFSIIVLMTAGVKTTPADDNYKWQRFSGNWEIKNSHLSETRAWASPWYYYELLNYNSVTSKNRLGHYNSLEFSFTVNKPGIEIKTRDKVPEFMVSFNITSPFKNWNFHIYGMKFTADEEAVREVGLIFSDRINRTLRYATKNNTFVKVLTSKTIKLEYGKEYKVKINLAGNNAVLIIDGEKILSGKMPENEHEGKIAFSSKNLLLKIRDVKVYNNKEIVFKDDFTKDTIYVPKKKARKSKKK